MLRYFKKMLQGSHCTSEYVACLNGQRRGLDFLDCNLGYYFASNGMMILQEVIVILGTYLFFSLSEVHSSKVLIPSVFLNK